MGKNGPGARSMQMFLHLLGKPSRTNKLHDAGMLCAKESGKSAGRPLEAFNGQWFNAQF